MFWRYSAVASGACTISGCLLLTNLSDLSGGEGVGLDASAADVVFAVDVADGSSAADASSVTFGEPETLARDEPGVVGIGVDTAAIYWTNQATQTLTKLAKGGGAASIVLVNTKGPPTDLVVDPAGLSWIELTPNAGFQRAKNDGSAVTSIDGHVIVRLVGAGGRWLAASRSADTVTWYVSVRDTTLVQIGGVRSGTAVITAMTFDGTFVYLHAGGQILRGPPRDGSAEEVFATDVATDMISDGEKVYWLGSDGAVRALATASPGGEPAVLATGFVGLSRVVLDDALYVTASGLAPRSGKVVRIAKDGSSLEELATGLASPKGIAVDATGVYWVNTDDGTIMRLARR